MNLPSSFQIVFYFGMSLSRWISIGFSTLILDEPAALDEGHLISLKRGMKIKRLFGNKRGFFTFAGWKIESAVKIICMAMVLSREKGRFSLGGSVTL